MLSIILLKKSTEIFRYIFWSRPYFYGDFVNRDFWRKFRFLKKLSIFDKNLDFWRKFRFLTKIWIWLKFEFCQKNPLIYIYFTYVIWHLGGTPIFCKIRRFCDAWNGNFDSKHSRCCHWTWFKNSSKITYFLFGALFL